MSTEITVQGRAQHFHPPERGTVQAAVSAEGPAMQPVYDRVVRELEGLQASVAALHDPDCGPVTWWSTQHVRTWSKRPWNQEGKQLPLVHHASVGVEVKFRDFAALSRWVSGHVETTEGFTVQRITWALTEARRQQLTQEVRTRAVRHARERAQQYADALELGRVRPVALADQGMLGEGLHSHATETTAFARHGSAGGVELELVPEDIEVSAVVDARFVTEPAS